MGWHLKRAVIGGLAGIAALAAANANAAEFPSRPIRLVVPYAVGGPTDILGRLVADFLAKDLKQATFVENKPGAQGAIGAEAVARGDAEGYSLLVVSGSMLVLNPMLYKKLSYDPVRDFRILALITEVPVVMEVHPSVPARTVADFVAYAKQHPGKLSFGSAGTGGTIYLAGEMFRQMAGIEMTHVPYKGCCRAEKVQWDQGLSTGVTVQCQEQTPAGTHRHRLSNPRGDDSAELATAEKSFLV